MKKIVALFFAMAFAVSITNASAMGANETKVLDKLGESVTINGKECKIDASYINQANNFLQNVTLSDTDTATILSKIDEAWALAKEENATSIFDLSTEKKAEFLDIANEAAAVVGVTLTIKDGTIEGKDKDGNIVLTGSQNPVKKTGSDLFVTGIVLAAILAAVAGCGVFAAKKNLFATAA